MQRRRAAISGRVKPRNTVASRTRKDPTIGQTKPMIIVPRSAGKSKYEGLTISNSVLIDEDMPFFLQPCFALIDAHDTVATRCTISRSWLEKKTASPFSRVSLVRRSAIALADSSSTPESGSSKIMIFGFTINARAIRIRCLCPPDNEKKISQQAAAIQSDPKFVCLSPSPDRCLDRAVSGRKLPSRQLRMHSGEN